MFDPQMVISRKRENVVEAASWKANTDNLPCHPMSLIYNTIPRVVWRMLRMLRTCGLTPGQAVAFVSVLPGLVLGMSAGVALPLLAHFGIQLSFHRSFIALLPLLPLLPFYGGRERDRFSLITRSI